MSKDKIEVNMNVYDIPIVIEALEEANKEIARLHSIIKEAIEYLKEECLFDGKSYCSDLCYDDIPELVNILNGENNENNSTSK